MYIQYDDISDPVKFVLDIALKEAKKEERLTDQLLITMLSAYSNNPINLLINAPSGVGKNYVINTVASLFPQSDILSLAGMTEKALFHRSGSLVLKNEYTGEYESIETELNDIEYELNERKNELKQTRDKNQKQSQQNSKVDVKFTINSKEKGKKLFDSPETNKITYSESQGEEDNSSLTTKALIPCHYCDYSYNDEKEVERHSIISHLGLPARPDPSLLKLKQNNKGTKEDENSDSKSNNEQMPSSVLSNEIGEKQAQNPTMDSKDSKDSNLHTNKEEKEVKKESREEKYLREQEEMKNW
jgi:uncharacterized C2H2 Zn-finger protein